MSTPVTSVSVNNVRCFSGEQRAQLSKITLLVGENSVGKTSFLGCLNAVGRLAGLDELQDPVNWFDREPFSMGSFDTLARTGSTSFRVAIGLADGPFSRFAIKFAEGTNVSPKEVALEVRLSGKPSETAPTLTIVRENPESRSERWRFDGPAFRFRLGHSDVSYVQFTTWLSQRIRHGLLPFAGDVTQFRKRVGDTTNEDLAAFGKFTNFFRHRFRPPEIPLRINPIQAHGLEPERLYRFNPLDGLGDHLDLDAIAELGHHLGVFDGIEVRQLGREAFEVLVDVSGAFRNLRDVGYGVASVLPFLTSLAGTPPNSLFLMQQPEVHLHPSAQAKLVEMMARSNHAFVIETHSDHVIRWLRILVKEQHLSPSDVGIIYFEPLPEDQSATGLHQISLDARANLSGQPRTYRQFFSRETARLLGFPT